MILKDILGFDIDFALLDKTIGKIKNQINLNTNKIALIDDEIDNSMRNYAEEQKRTNASFFDEIQKKVDELQMYVPTDSTGYSSVQGI